MPSWKRLILSLSVAGFFTISSAAATPTFNEVLDSLSEDSLQEALGSGSPGSDQTFAGGERAALQALHDTDPDTAEKVLSMVQLELGKRQLPSVGVSAGVSVPDVVPSLPVSVSVPSVALPTSAAQTSSDPLPPSTPTPTPSPLPSSPPPRVSQSQQEPTSSAPVPTSSFPESTSQPQVTATTGNGGLGGGNGGVSSSGDPVIVPVPQTSVAGGQTTVNTGFATFQPIRSTVIDGTNVPLVPVTATNTQGQTITTGQPLGIPPGSGPGAGGNGGGRDVTTTDQYGNTIVLPNASDGAVITATDVNGRIITTTYHPGVTRAVKSTLVLSSTLAGGQNTLVTLTAFVVPNAVTGAAGAEDGGTRTRAAAGLQTGNVADTTRRIGAEALALAIGVAGLAFAL